MDLEEINGQVNLNGKSFPKNASRANLEKIGARHLKTDNFKVKEIERNIEYMVLENDSYMAVWRKSDVKNESYELHLLAPGVIRFPVLV